MRSLGAVFEDATTLFADASALMRGARGLRQELEAATGMGADEAERLVHGAIAAGIEAGRVQGREAALRGLREARAASGGAEPAWLRRLQDGLTDGGRDTGWRPPGRRIAAEGADE
jgi:hypothetical protein